MKRIAATLAVAAAIVGVVPSTASAATTDDLCNSKMPVVAHLLIPFCEE